jgi:uncharacterized membrane protein YfcA
MFILFITDFDSGVPVCILLTTVSLSLSFVCTVVDAILVLQARKDPELGSQDLVTVLWLSQSFGSILGSCIAAVATEKFHPRWVFLLYGCSVLVVGVYAFFLSNQAEAEYLNGDEPEASDYSSEYIEG